MFFSCFFHVFVIVFVIVFDHGFERFFDQHLAKNWPKAGQKLAKSWPKAGQKLASWALNVEIDVQHCTENSPKFWAKKENDLCLK